MRISTSTIYNTGLQSIQNQTVEMLKVQQQLATGRRVLSPEDDPTAASSVLDLTQYQGVNNQYRVNADNAKSALEMEESTLSSVTDLLQSMKALAVSAGNPTMSAADRARIGVEVDGGYKQLLGLANQKDGKGQYLFSGYQGATAPFTEPGIVRVPAPPAATSTIPPTPANWPVKYNGDQGQRLVQISASRQIATSDSGVDVFKTEVGNQDLFETLKTFATRLNDSTLTPAQVTQTVNDALNGLGESLDNVLKIRASVGARLKEIDAAQSADEELNLHFEQAISSLRDVDYAKAASELTQRQLYLEAAQKSFLKVSGLSLFNFL